MIELYGNVLPDQRWLMSEVCHVIAIDPGANAGWAEYEMYPCQHHPWWTLSNAGLCEPANGTRPVVARGICDLAIVELPNHEKGDTAKRTNDLFKTALRAGVLAESTNASYLLWVHPHTWKGSVPKELHNKRCLERLDEDEMSLLRKSLSVIPASKHNNVIDAIGIGLAVLGRW